MHVNYEHKPAMTFIGFSSEIAPNEGYVKCPAFWEEAYAKKYARLWQTGVPETEEEKAVCVNQIGMYALCIMNEDGGFEYMIAGLYTGGSVPAGMKLYEMPESEWAVFSAKGPIPDALQQLNTEVWEKWFPEAGQRLEANGRTTLEVYSAGNPQSPDYECGIWVPVKRKA